MQGFMILAIIGSEKYTLVFTRHEFLANSVERAI